MKTRRPAFGAAALLTTLALSITGCGGGSSSQATGSLSRPAAPSGVASSQIKAIRQCLQAAGLAHALPSGAPQGLPSGAPQGLPSGAPTAAPSGFSGGPGGPGGQFDDPKVRAALKACGLRLPTPGGG